MHCGSLYDETYLQDLIVEGATNPIGKTTLHWKNEHLHASTEDVVQRVESLLILQGRAKQK